MPLSSSSRLALARPKSLCPGLSDITKNNDMSIFQSCKSSRSGIFFQDLRGIRSDLGRDGLEEVEKNINNMNYIDIHRGRAAAVSGRVGKRRSHDSSAPRNSQMADRGM